MTQKRLLLSNALFLTMLIPFDLFCMRVKADYGRSPLHIAAWENDLQQATLILKQDHDPDKIDGDKNSPLHLAINRGFLRMATLLLEHGADKNAQNADGNTPLHSAANFNRSELAIFLLQRGADYNKQNNLNQRPLDVAKKFKRTEVAKILEKAQTTIKSMPDNPNPNMLEQSHRKEALASQS
jgi:ankyrin repeat protein